MSERIQHDAFTRSVRSLASLRLYLNLKHAREDALAVDDMIDALVFLAAKHSPTFRTFKEVHATAQR